ncbi:MAG: periplasmic heavy metal sensor [Pseudomonadota bacterium]
MNKWLGIALVISLVINLALAGFVAGRLTKGFVQGPPAHDITRAYPRFANELTDQRKADLRPQIREYLKSMRGSRTELREARGAVNAAILASPFESRGLEQALEQMNAVQQNLTQSAQNSFVQFISSLDEAERARFVERSRRFEQAPPLRRMRPMNHSE